MKKTIAALLFILLSFVLEIARSEDKIQFHKGDVRYYLTQYQESDHFFVDVFKVDARGFQSREEHFEFDTIETADLKFLELYQDYNSMPILESSARDLKPYATFKLWSVTQEWNEEWEDRYTAWMKIQLTSNFLLDHKIATDCADVPLTYRWIFSMLNGLPAGNHLAGSQKLFTQDSAPQAWLELPVHENWWQNQRFLKALDYIHNNTYTASVYDDMYPVGINNRAVSAGVVWVINKVHTYNIGQVNFNSANWMKMYSSTVPRQIRRLSVHSFDLTRPVFDESGFQRPRWLKKINNKWQMTAALEMPWYSLEQYSVDFSPEANLFAPAVYQKLSGKPVDPEVWLQGLINNLDRMTNDRIGIVESGFKACAPNLCPEGTDEYEVYSTPSRDRRILETIQKAEYFISLNPGKGLEEQWQFSLSNWVYRIYRSDFNGSFLLTMGDVVRIWKNARYSFDPNVPMESRWGVTNPVGPAFEDADDDFELGDDWQMIPHAQL